MLWKNGWVDVLNDDFKVEEFQDDPENWKSIGTWVKDILTKTNQQSQF